MVRTVNRDIKATGGFLVVVGDGQARAGLAGGLPNIVVGERRVRSGT
jgi:hypothetical protein